MGALHCQQLLQALISALVHVKHSSSAGNNTSALRALHQLSVPLPVLACAMYPNSPRWHPAAVGNIP
jgi:hypothetical protein